MEFVWLRKGLLLALSFFRFYHKIDVRKSQFVSVAAEGVCVLDLAFWGIVFCGEGLFILASLSAKIYNKNRKIKQKFM